MTLTQFAKITHCFDRVVYIQENKVESTIKLQ